VLDERTGIQRTAEQRRADVLAELPGRHLQLLQAFQQGKTFADLVPEPSEDVRADLFALPVRNPARMYVHSPMSTLLELDNRSGWVEGLGPISAHHARLLRPTAELQAVWVDAGTGIPLGLDATVHPPVGEPDWDDPQQVTTAAEQVRQRLRSMLRPTTVEDRAEPGRFPSAKLSRQLQIRDLRCTGVGCPRHGRSCEQDHLVEVCEGGLTAIWTMDLKTLGCHQARHAGWQCVRDPLTGSTMWISPAGGEYTRRSPWRPPPRVTGPLPPPRLERPDRGKPRTFGTEDSEEPPAPPEPLPPAPPPSEDDQPPPRKTALDHVREIKANTPPTDPGSKPTWGRPWHSDAPPPF